MDGEQLEFSILDVYDHYIADHISLGRLQEQGIICWLKDENTVTIDPLLSIAVGGIKLMVATHQLERARSILQEPS